MPTPYTYLIGWTAHNKWYYGCQYHNKANPLDLWVKYFTSSQTVAEFRKEHGEPDQIMICETFGSAIDAKEWEDEVLMAIPLDQRDCWLNLRFGSFKGIVETPEKAQKISELRKLNPISTKGYTNEYRAAHGMKLIPGKPKGSKEKESTRKKKSEMRKGKVTVKNIITGETKLVTCEESKILKQDGEWQAATKGANTGRKHTEETKQKQREKQLGRRPWNYGLTKVDPRVAKYVERSAITNRENRKHKPRKSTGSNVPRCSCVVCGKETNLVGLTRFHKHQSAPSIRLLK